MTFLARFGIRVIVVRRRRRAVFDPHDPAAGQLAFGLQEDGALCLEDLERVRPELQPQDVAFVGQQVVADVQPRHRLQVRAHDAIDDERADRRGLVAAVFEIVQRLRADRRAAPCPPSYHSVTRE